MWPAGSLAAAFLDALPEALRTPYAAYAGLADELARLAGDARAAEVAVDDAAFVAAVALRIDPDALPERALGGVRAGELALALACARGEPAALARFDALLREAIDRAAARFRDAPIQRDDLRQAIRERLLVATDGTLPRIATYQGRGDLRSWLRMVATRYLIDATRADAARPDRAVADERLTELAGAGDDPELAFLKQHYRAEFRAAFATALSALPPRDRNILRHRYLDNLEVAELATLYGLHRVSMSRTLTRIRDQLLAAIRTDFLVRVGLGRDDLDEVIALIASQLELSLSGLLRR